MIRKLAAVLTFALLFAGMPGVANADWSSPGSGRGYASADVAPTGKQPTVTLTTRSLITGY